MSSYNKVILIGRVGGDPETKSTQNGKNVSSFSLATSDTWMKDGKKEEKTEWHRIIVWEKQSEIAEKYVKKGMLVSVEGKIQSREYKANDGTNKKAYEILCSNIRLLSSSNSQNQSTNEAPSSDFGLDEDVPF